MVFFCEEHECVTLTVIYHYLSLLPSVISWKDNDLKLLMMALFDGFMELNRNFDFAGNSFSHEATSAVFSIPVVKKEIAGADDV